MFETLFFLLHFFLIRTEKHKPTGWNAVVRTYYQLSSYQPCWTYCEQSHTNILELHSLSEKKRMSALQWRKQPETHINTTHWFMHRNQAWYIALEKFCQATILCVTSRLISWSTQTVIDTLFTIIRLVVLKAEVAIYNMKETQSHASRGVTSSFVDYLQILLSDKIHNVHKT